MTDPILENLVDVDRQSHRQGFLQYVFNVNRWFVPVTAVIGGVVIYTHILYYYPGGVTKVPCVMQARHALSELMLNLSGIAYHYFRTGQLENITEPNSDVQVGAAKLTYLMCLKRSICQQFKWDLDQLFASLTTNKPFELSNDFTDSTEFASPIICKCFCLIHAHQLRYVL